MGIEEKNKMIEDYIKELALEVNKQYKGLIDEDRIKEIYKKHEDSEKNLKEDILPDINKYVEEIIDEFLELKKKLEELMKLREKQEITELQSMDMNVDKKQEMFLGEQQVNLMIISELDSKDSIKSYIESACSQFPYVNTDEIVESYDSIITKEQIDEIKKTLYQRYEDNLTNYFANSPLKDVETAREKLIAAGIKGEELEDSLKQISEGKTKEVFEQLIDKHGKDFLEKLNVEEIKKEENQEIIEEEEQIEGNKVVFDENGNRIYTQTQTKTLRKVNPYYKNGFGYTALLVAIVSFTIVVISTITYLVISSIFK